MSSRPDIEQIILDSWETVTGGERPLRYNRHAMLLSGWKQIASHLRCGVRTAQRWAKHGLPVRRGKSPKSPVVADSEMLDAWVRHGGQLRQDMLDTEALITKSKRLLAELTAAQEDLRGSVATLHDGIKEIWEKQAALRRRQKNSRTNNNGQP